MSPRRLLQQASPGRAFFLAVLGLALLPIFILFPVLFVQTIRDHQAVQLEHAAERQVQHQQLHTLLQTTWRNFVLEHQAQELQAFLAPLLVHYGDFVAMRLAQSLTTRDLAATYGTGFEQVTRLARETQVPTDTYKSLEAGDEPDTLWVTWRPVLPAEAPRGQPLAAPVRSRLSLAALLDMPRAGPPDFHLAWAALFTPEGQSLGRLVFTDTVAPCEASGPGRVRSGGGVCTFLDDFTRTDLRYATRLYAAEGALYSFVRLAHPLLDAQLGEAAPILGLGMAVVVPELSAYDNPFEAAARPTHALTHALTFGGVNLLWLVPLGLGIAGLSAGFFLFFYGRFARRVFGLCGSLWHWRALVADPPLGGPSGGASGGRSEAAGLALPDPDALGPPPSSTPGQRRLRRAAFLLRASCVFLAECGYRRDFRRNFKYPKRPGSGPGFAVIWRRPQGDPGNPGDPEDPGAS